MIWIYINIKQSNDLFLSILIILLLLKYIIIILMLILIIHYSLIYGNAIISKDTHRFSILTFANKVDDEFKNSD
jgi:lipopolysaccharide/colanic/teichoic acid biosynthesis glycosyltransferase